MQQVVWWWGVVGWEEGVRGEKKEEGVGADRRWLWRQRERLQHECLHFFLQLCLQAAATHGSSGSLCACVVLGVVEAG
jgi:hypothetical protein